jgi:uncharacterized protein YbbC (DUF1343 family)
MPEVVFKVVRLPNQEAFDEWRRTDKMFTPVEVDLITQDLLKRLYQVQIQSTLIQLDARERNLEARIDKYQGVIDFEVKKNNWMLKHVIDDLEHDIWLIQADKKRLTASLSR